MVKGDLLLHLSWDVRSDAMRMNVHGTNTRTMTWTSMSRNRFLGFQGDFEIYDAFLYLCVSVTPFLPHRG